jgi:PhnB protein
LSSDVKSIPENSSKVIPRLFCRDVLAELEFCKTAFEAVELGKRPGPDGSIIHALITISGAMVMIEAEYPSLPSSVPAMDGSSPVVIFA